MAVGKNVHEKAEEMQTTRTRRVRNKINVLRMAECIARRRTGLIGFVGACVCFIIGANRVRVYIFFFLLFVDFLGLPAMSQILNAVRRRSGGGRRGWRWRALAVVHRVGRVALKTGTLRRVRRQRRAA